MFNQNHTEMRWRSWCQKFLLNQAVSELSLGFISSNYLAHPIISNIANSINDNQVKNKQWLVSHVVSYINNSLSNQQGVHVNLN